MSHCLRTRYDNTLKKTGLCQLAKTGLLLLDLYKGGLPYNANVAETDGIQAYP